MKIVLVLVPSPDCWRERLLGTSTKTGFKGLKTFSHDSIFVGLIDFVKFDYKYMVTCNSIRWFHTVSYMQNEATVA